MAALTSKPGTHLLSLALPALLLAALGGTLAVKIDAPDMKVSLDLSTSRTSDCRRQSVRIKRVPAKRQPA